MAPADTTISHDIVVSAATIISRYFGASGYLNLSHEIVVPAATIISDDIVVSVAVIIYRTILWRQQLLLSVRIVVPAATIICLMILLHHGSHNLSHDIVVPVAIIILYKYQMVRR